MKGMTAGREQFLGNAHVPVLFVDATGIECRANFQCGESDSPPVFVSSVDSIMILGQTPEGDWNPMNKAMSWNGMALSD
jgi:hypothetical protein